RSRGANVVGAVGLGPAAEVMALDGALEALADRDRGDLHLLAGLEARDGDVVPNLRLGGALGGLLLALALLALAASGAGGDVGVAELHECLQPCRARLLQMAGLGLADPVFGDRHVGELDGVVAIAVGVANRGDLVGRGLDHGHGDRGAVVQEDARHAQLLADDGGHQRRISTSTPAGRVSIRCSSSTVFGVGWWMSISRLWVRISKCSRESLSLNGERITQYTFFSVGSGTGPATVAPVRCAVSTISRAARSIASWSYALRRILILVAAREA